MENGENFPPIYCRYDKPYDYNPNCYSPSRTEKGFECPLKIRASHPFHVLQQEELLLSFTKTCWGLWPLKTLNLLTTRSWTRSRRQRKKRLRLSRSESKSLFPELYWLMGKYAHYSYSCTPGDTMLAYTPQISVILF